MLYLKLIHYCKPTTPQYIKKIKKETRIKKLFFPANFIDVKRLSLKKKNQYELWFLQLRKLSGSIQHMRRFR